MEWGVWYHFASCSSHLPVHILEDYGNSVQMLFCFAKSDCWLVETQPCFWLAEGRLLVGSIHGYGLHLGQGHVQDGHYVQLGTLIECSIIGITLLYWLQVGRKIPFHSQDNRRTRQKFAGKQDIKGKTPCEPHPLRANMAKTNLIKGRWANQ